MLNKSIAILIVFTSIIYYACNVNDPEVLAIDGINIEHGTLFSSIDRKNFNSSLPSERRGMIMEFVGEWLAAEEAIKFGKELTDIENNAVISFRNQLIISSVINNQIKPSVQDDSTVTAVREATGIDRHIKEIIIFHDLSKGYTVKQNPQEAKKIANSAVKRIRSNNISFEEAVSIYSAMPIMKLRKGSIGILKYGKYPKHYNDAVWYIPEDSIIGPIKTDFGFHIVQAGAVEYVENKKSAAQMEKEISGGKYGVLKEAVDGFSRNMRSAYNSDLDSLSIIEMWNKIVLDLDYTNQPFSALATINHGKPLGHIGNDSLSLDWFIEQSYRHAQISNSSIYSPYALLINCSDILNRFLTVRWAEKNNDIYNDKMKLKVQAFQRNLLKNAYVESKIDMNLSLTEAVVLNRLVQEHVIKINDKFIRQ